MTDHEALLQIQAIANGQLTSTDQPPPPPPVPSAGGQALTVEGVNVRLPGGPSVWTVPDRTTNFTIEIGGGEQPISVTIKTPDGNVAHRPRAGIYDVGFCIMTFDAGAGTISAQNTMPGTYSVEVNVTHYTGLETIRLSPA